MHSQSRSETGYLSYLLRIWRKRDGKGKAVWCASLEEPGTHNTESFEDTQALFAFLQKKMGIEEPQEHSQHEPQHEQQADQRQ